MIYEPIRAQNIEGMQLNDFVSVPKQLMASQAGRWTMIRGLQLLIAR
jgi:hypothetical protein